MGQWAHVTCQRSNLTGPLLKSPEIHIYIFSHKDKDGETTKTQLNADQDKAMKQVTVCRSEIHNFIYINVIK